MVNIFKRLIKRKTFKKEKALTQEEYEIIKLGMQYSMASWERLYANINSIKYLVNSQIEGAIVECGVWRGGSMLTMLETLKQYSVINRDIYLYDTFTGMSTPSKEDGIFAHEKFKELQTGEDKSNWCCADLNDVKSTINLSEYPNEKLHYVKGKIEDTVPGTIPDEISLLRLDMDWYSPTIHALTYLYPKVQSGGVIILDDYGHWDGCKQAVDRFVEENDVNLLLNRIDYTGRIAIKVH